MQTHSQKTSQAYLNRSNQWLGRLTKLNLHKI